MSKLYSIEATQKVPGDIDTIWDFISSPRNLKTITPDYMGFEITSKMDSEKMYAGQIISYNVSPVAGIKLGWVTEITQVVHNQYFIDEQRFGPYSLWHHKHFVKAIEGGVEMYDLVHYKLPFWFLGDIAHALFVKKQLNEIFDYRYKKMEEIFGKFS